MSHDFLTDWVKGFPTILQEHTRLTTHASADMIKAGAARLKEEREFCQKEGWGEPSDEFLAAACYEAMVFCAIGRGLSLPAETAERRTG